jgi:ADP-ribose pyrophosphatase YjhB (NUDIX family)
MATSRRFAHFKRGVSPPRMKEVPEGGFCISAFVIISKKNRPQQVLMGRISKKAPWDHVGALDPERVERHSVGWMLPSSGLLLGESPKEAANRILIEQLGVAEQSLEGPSVFSEVYGPMNHWDLEFLFLGERDSTPENDMWSDLRFIDVTKTRRAEIIRGHEDILAHVEKRTAD